MREDYTGRARALIGTRFRAQGRGPDGLDCVGLVLEVFGIRAETVRRDYALRGEAETELKAQLMRFFRPVPAGKQRCGDLLLLGPATDQLHLAVLTQRGFVHAHAGLRRVVETPGAPAWPVFGVFRRRTRASKG